MEQTIQNTNWSQLYDRYYKILLLIPAILLILSFGYLFYFYNQHGDIIKKDVSLTGGTTITIYDSTDLAKFKSDLAKSLEDFSVRSIYDLTTGKQIAVIVQTPEEVNKTQLAIEKYFGYKLNDKNSSIEFTGSALSSSFYQELRIAVMLAFVLMALVVFWIFGDKLKYKIYVSIVSLFVLVILLFFPLNTMSILFLILGVLGLGYLYFTHSIPSFAVVLSAFCDIIMPLAVVNYLGISISSAGIVAFLMLIGYSVDTDILLTARVLKRSDSPLNTRIYESFKTGTTMTLTAIATVVIALFITQSYSDVLKQMFTIISIGLFFDLINTWIANASILKLYCEKKNIQ